MANFAPAGNIWLGNVPFDNSYRHTLALSSWFTPATKEGKQAAQATTFRGMCNTGIRQGTYTYVRFNNAIRIQGNAEDYYTYDYVMYQNANYGSKWFYAFIVGVNYVNENVTEFELEIDVLQTWMFDYDLVAGFVEREHVNSDLIGEHLNAEPSMDIQYKYDKFQDFTFDLDDCYAVILTNEYPDYTGYAWDGSQTYQPNPIDFKPGVGAALSGKTYNGGISGAKALVYDFTGQREESDLSKRMFFHDIEQFSECGIADSIVDAFMVPKEYFGAVDQSGFPTSLRGFVLERKFTNPISGESTRSRPIPGVYTPVESFNPVVKPENWNRFIEGSSGISVDGYYPHNNKLLCYPYTFIEVGDFSGRKQDYRWEWFNHAPNTNAPTGVIFTRRVPTISDGNAFIQPKNYNGISVPTDGQGNEIQFSVYTEQPFEYSWIYRISYYYSTYKNWMAQNQVKNNLAIVGSIASMVMGFAPGIGKAVGILGKGAKTVTETFNKAGERVRTKITNYEKADSIPSTAGIAGLASTLGQIDYMSRQPNISKGNINGNSKFQSKYSGWYLANVSIRAEFAKIIDGFFDMYGYQIDTVKVPNRFGRTYWNYIKMQNACHRGTVPADQMDKINEIYDSGITFWHDTNIGNYNRSNSIV